MKRLFIDLDICNNCEECRVSCDYFYHPQNNGITNLREFATFALFCRHCEEAPCVNACYHNALEKQPDGILKRYKMRCTSCKSCAIACPFGTIFADFTPYLDSRCDYCVGISTKLPKCVTTCPEKAIEVKEVKEDIEQNIYFIGESLAVHSRKWSKEDLQPPKKK
ncbi:MAG: 4Fe-4S ferredoxin [Candidatus Omnitrophota bacterium]|nr:MAG: 4Fe-4S ferredoxin [Candidatus Omnitrophota bacterium]